MLISITREEGCVDGGGRGLVEVVVMCTAEETSSTLIVYYQYLGYDTR